MGGVIKSERRNARIEACYQLLLTVALFILIAAKADSQTSTLTPGADTYLKSGTPNQSQGTSTLLRIQQSGNNRSLVRFNQSEIVSAVGSGSLVSATLELYIQTNGNNWGSSGDNVNAHRLTVDWTEPGATWNCAIDSNPGNVLPDCNPQWNGGTFEAESTANVLHTNGLTGWVQFDVTTDVASFLTGTSNYGWLLKKENENQSGQVDYTSREGIAAQRPKLVLVVESATSDTVPPKLNIQTPNDLIIINDTSPQIIVTYSDGGSGVNLSTLLVQVDGNNITPSCSSSSSSATCESSTLVAGTHTITAQLSDVAGNQATKSFEFELLLGGGSHLVTVSAAADTYLKLGTPNQNQGSETILRIRAAGANRSLIKFDQAEIASLIGDGTLLSASLKLFIEDNSNNWGSTGRNVDAHKIIANWTEAGATWNCAIDSNPSNILPDCLPLWLGGTYGSQPSDTLLHTNGLTGWVNFDVTADVAAFLSGTTNHGWIIRKSNELQSGQVDYTSREGTSSQRPQLVIVFNSSNDTTPPTITAFVSPQPNAAGWNNTDVTVTFNCSDVESGIASCASPVTLTTEGANQLISGSATDNAGNSASVSVALNIDKSPPQISVDYPIDGGIVNTVEITAIGTNNSGVSGLETLTCNSDPATLTGSSFECTISLNEGANSINFSAQDKAGNSNSLLISTILDTQSPILTIESPSDGTVLNTPIIQVAGTTSDGSGILQITVNGQNANLSGSSYSAEVELHEGTQTIIVVATDSAGNQLSKSIQVILDTTPPVINISTPLDEETTNLESIQVTGNVVDTTSIASVQINGAPASLNGNQFEGNINLNDGGNSILVAANDTLGNSASSTVTVTRIAVPEVTITSPSDLTWANTTTIQVTGTLSDPNLSVEVNGVVASTTGNSFVAVDVPLLEGGNIITATATSNSGRVGTASIRVFRDRTPPILSIDSPIDGSIVSSSSINLSGMVNDLSLGTANAGQVTVTVNGINAQVANRSFLATDISLQPGTNTILVSATDPEGNNSTASISVTRIDSSAARIQLISGDNQNGVVSTELDEPLIVKVIDGSGNAVPNKDVAFKVIENNGILINGASSARSLLIKTGSDGQAEVRWKLGTRSGAGNNRVTASSIGFGGKIEFIASSIPSSAFMIHQDSGSNQYGIVGQQLPRPFVVVVTDSGNNRLSGIPVTFSILNGLGNLYGETEYTATTDTDGRALAVLALGPNDGVENNVVQVTFQDNPNPPVMFSASGKIAGDPSQTKISGVVLDNSNIPIEGVTMRIKDTPLFAVTDSQGQFTVVPVPVGHIYLIADGSTAQREGSWPTLEFEMVTVPGHDNTIEMPIYLLPLDLASGIYVDETTGGTITLPSIPGFSLNIKPGSATFPDGQRKGVVSVTMVHPDKIPMTPNFGQQPRLTVTIQPVGVRFDPPAAITVPNLDGLAPGEIAEILSFDHDLGTFIAVGTGSVTEDGSKIQSDPGVGIIKGGWHFPTNNPRFAAFGRVQQQCVPSPGPNLASTSAELCTDLRIDGNYILVPGGEASLTVVQENQNEIFRVLGGMRARLFVGNPTDFPTIVNYEWSSNVGKFFRTDASGQGQSTISGPDVSQVFWEGDWVDSMNATIGLTIRTVSESVTGNRNIKTRPLTTSLSGDDVVALQSMLRSLGISESPDPAKQGVIGPPVTIDGSYGTATSTAVDWIQRYDEIPGTGNVDTQTLGKFKLHWADYVKAYDRFSNSPTININHPNFNGWVLFGSNELRKTYTDTIHSLARHPSQAVYENILKEWISKEAGTYGHWGFDRPFRITIGSGDTDPIGSIGFSQIQNRYKYGGPNIKQNLGNVNLYDPEHGVRGFALHSNDTNLGGGFYRAFVAPQSYRPPPFTRPSTHVRLPNNYQDDEKDLLSKGIMAYKRGASFGDFTWRIWPEFLRFYLPPTPQTAEGTRTSMKYTLEIQSNAGMPLESWTWTEPRIGTGPDSECDSNLAPGSDDQIWFDQAPGVPNQKCITAGVDGILQSVTGGNDTILQLNFSFSETEWLSGLSWEAKRAQALP